MLKGRTRARAYCLRRTFMHVGSLAGNFNLKVSCRDINKIFSEAPALIKMFRDGVLICFSFSDQVYGKLDLNGNFVDFVTGLTDYSPTLFLPGLGKVYTINDPVDENDRRSMAMKIKMKELNLSACYLDNTGELFVSFDPGKGDRFLDKSEMAAFDHGVGAGNTGQSAKPEPAAAKEPKIDPKKAN